MLRKRVWLREGVFVPMWSALCVDTLLCGAAFYLVSVLFGLYGQQPVYPPALPIYIVAYMLFSAVSFVLFQSYTRSARRVSDRDTIRLVSAVLFANALLALLHMTGADEGLLAQTQRPIPPLSPLVLLLNISLSALLLGGLRMLVRFYYKYSYHRDRHAHKSIPLLIYETDPGNRSVSEAVGQARRFPYRLIGYVTQNIGAAGKMIDGIPIYYDDGDMGQVFNRTGAGALLIDPDRLSQTAKQRFVEVCQKQGIILLCMPSSGRWKILGGDRPVSRIRKVRIEDLLARTSVCTDIRPSEILKEKCLLITGAAGSIGSEIARQLTHFRPTKLILCDSAETPLYNLWLELQEKYPPCELMPFLGDVRNKAQMELMFERFRPQVVFHAAAYKHVTMMEHMPCQSVSTNILGTMHIADLSVKHGAEAFVMISSDKAVNPTNVMGTSKRIAEIYVQSLSGKLDGGDSPTRFITTRFGNVLGSSGSVVPFFEQQIEQGGPLKVTHPDVFRYFMTIPEACGLVLEAANIGRNGEVFILDMGQPVKIRELAENMIRLSGYEPYKEIDIVYTGLRPGEKLSEELLYDKETVTPTCHPKILIGKTRKYDYDVVLPQLEKLIDLAARGDREETVRQMKAIVPEFVSNNTNFESLFPVEDHPSAS